MEQAPRIEGPDDAPVVVMHADLSCPDCALAYDRLVRSGARIDLRHFVLRSRGAPARNAAHAAEAAANQGAFWAFARHLLTQQGRHDLPQLWALARREGLDVERFEADRHAGAGAERIATETRAALEGGASEVPALFADDDGVEWLRRNGYDGQVRTRSKK